MGRGPSRFNVVSVFFFLLLVSAVYSSYKYIPLIWKKGELGSVVKEATFGATRNPDDQVRKTVVEMAKGDLGIEIREEDVEITRFTDRVRVKVTWRPVVKFIGGRSAQHSFEIVETSTIY